METVLLSEHLSSRQFQLYTGLPAGSFAYSRFCQNVLSVSKIRNLQTSDFKQPNRNMLCQPFQFKQPFTTRFFQPFQNVMNPWYFFYQPVSYKLEGNSILNVNHSQLMQSWREKGFLSQAEWVPVRSSARSSTPAESIEAWASSQRSIIN